MNIILESLFGNYKRVVGIFLFLILTLSVPITISLLESPQDIRQQAQVPQNPPTKQVRPTTVFNPSPTQPESCPAPPKCLGKLIVNLPSRTSSLKCPIHSCEELKLQATITPSPQAVLQLTGDLDANNTVNLLDFNIIIYYIRNRGSSCPSNIDINQDGKCDETDLNYFFRVTNR